MTMGQATAANRAASEANLTNKSKSRPKRQRRRAFDGYGKPRFCRATAIANRWTGTLQRKYA